jgi:chromosome segregation ATPase
MLSYLFSRKNIFFDDNDPRAEQIEGMKKQEKAMKDEKLAMNEQLTQWKEQEKTLQGETRRLKNQALPEIKKKLIEVDGEISQTVKSIQELRKAIDQVDLWGTTGQADKSVLEAKLSWKQQISQLEDKLKQLKEAKAHFDDQLKQIQAAITNYTQQVQQLQQNIQMLQNKIRQTDVSLKILKINLTAQAGIAQKQKQVSKDSKQKVQAVEAEQSQSSG